MERVMALRALQGKLHERARSRVPCDERGSFHSLNDNECAVLDADVEAQAYTKIKLARAAEHSAVEPDGEVEVAKRMIAEAKNGKELLKKAQENVKPDWFSEQIQLSGNIYRIAAFGKHHSNYMIQKFAEDPTRGLKAWIAYFGFLTVSAVQIIGPPSLCLSTVFSWGIFEEHRYKWEKLVDANGFHPCFADWHHIALTKFLGMILIMCFCLNATYALLNEIGEWRKVDDIFRYLQHLTPGIHLPGEKYLFIGGLINCWMIVWCCIDAYILIGGSVCPKDTVMDSLGLIFLFNLDDVTGDLGFVSKDSWPGDELGWVYENMVKKSYVPPGKEDTKAELNRFAGCGAKTIRFLFRASACVTGVLAIGLPILSAATPWHDILPA